MLMENQRLADKVRRQESVLAGQEYVIATMVSKHPGLFTVNRAEDDSIILDGLAAEEDKDNNEKDSSAGQ
jgi:hypothetical protein